jgi:negative regulator of genetic competence, sporulation and motility
MQDNLQAIKESISTDREKENDDLNAILLFDDDDESISFKKNLETGNYSTSVSLHQISGCFFYCDTQLIPLHICLSYASSYRYLLFHVFRI